MSPQGTAKDVTYSLLKLRQERGLLQLSLNRPEARNALNDALRTELRQALIAAEADVNVRAVLLTGEGTNFCAGADIRELGERQPLSVAWTTNRIDAVIEAMSKPVIAAMHGPTFGGGMEVALACTLRVAADDFVGGLPEIRLGAFPALGGTQRLPRIIGEGRALDLMLTGRNIDAAEALSLGIVSRVYPKDEFLDRATQFAETIAAGAPVAMRVIIEATRRASDLSRQDGIDFERRLFGLVCGTEDMKEGMAAWKEKRRPNFKGR